jgi:hypothetical protein
MKWSAVFYFIFEQPKIFFAVGRRPKIERGFEYANRNAATERQTRTIPAGSGPDAYVDPIEYDQHDVRAETVEIHAAPY